MAYVLEKPFSVIVRSAMPGEMYRLYDEYKRDEWERFLHTVTEWDIKTYLDCLP